MLRRSLVLVFSCCVLTVAVGCDLLDPARPTVHPDTNVFGNLLEVTRGEADSGMWWAKVRVGVPRAFSKAEAESGHPTPVVEQGLIAEVLITADTVVIAGGGPGFIEDINPGTEVVVIPVMGSTRMVGTSNITVEASYFTDFEAFRRWQLPGLATAEDALDQVEDPSRINSAGVEHAPVPIAGGRVLYFSARLRPPSSGESSWLGARREGLVEPEGQGVAVERSFRAVLDEGGWSEAEPVRFPNLDEGASLRLSWVSEDETRCLVTVSEGEAASWIGAAARASAAEPWGPIERLEQLGEGAVADGAYLRGSSTKIVFTAWLESPGSHLMLHDPKAEESPLLLDPSVNTAANEWGARTGPANELFFNRDDRQFVLAEGTVREIAPPGPHRMIMTEAAPTADGGWLFVCMPKYRPVELDWDISVARWSAEDGTIGKPVPVDDWRP
jgi:hypothetical protein